MFHNTKITYLSGLCTLMLIGATWAATSDATPPNKSAALPNRAPDIYENLFPPELVVRVGQEIGLTQDQLNAIRTDLQALRPNLEEIQKKLLADTTALNNLVKQPHPDVPASLALLDKVLDDERAIKRLNLQLALKIRGSLTPQQIAQLTTIRERQLTGGGGGTPGGPPQAVRAKMQDVQTLAQKLRQDGKELGNIPNLMQDAKSAAQNGNYDAAEEALDKILTQLHSL